MFDIREYLKLYNKDINLAKNYCLEHDEIISKCHLIILDIEYFNEDSFENDYYKLVDLYSKLVKKEEKASLLPPLSYYSCFDAFDYKRSLKYSEEALKYYNDDNLRAIYYLSRLALDGLDKEAFEKLKELVFNGNLGEETIESAINIIATCYYKSNQEDEVEKLFNKAHLVLNNELLISKTQFRLVCLFDKEDEKIIEAFHNWKKVAEKEFIIHNFAITANAIIETRPMLVKKMLIELTDYLDTQINKDAYNATLTIIYYEMGNYKEAYKQSLTVSEEYFSYSQLAYYAKGDSILYLEDRRLYKEAETIFLKLHQEKPESVSVLSSLKWLYLINHEYDKLEQVLDVLEPLTGIKEDEFRAYCLASRGDYDKAFKYYKKSGDKKSFYNFYIKKFDETSKKIFDYYKKLDCPDDYRELAIMYFHGFGVSDKVDVELALEYATKAYNMEKTRNCHGSILGNIYLSLKEYDKAFKIFNEGYKRYINYKENCACSVGFYCYCLMNGYGVKKDEDKAYKILENFDFKDASDIVVYDYAYLSLKRKENLDKAYDLLLKHNEWRYDEGKYFLLIKIAKELNLDYKNFEKKFKDNLKYLPIREREYYLSNPEIFYLTNI